ncbi:MAG: PKD domain-containing protein [Planctomycetes bacterium]|nr:PKD domain-containing protein [Planctomycetota bacterium]
MRYKRLLIVFLAVAGISYPIIRSYFYEPDERRIYEVFLSTEFHKIDSIISKPGSNEPAEADFPQMAAMQNYMMTLDPKLKRVPSERLLSAYRFTTELTAGKSKTKDAFVWQTVGANMGGRTRTFAFDPGVASGNKVWIGGVTGGLWFNFDITNPWSSWIPVNNFWPSLSVSCIAFDPVSPSVFYVGTGEAQTAVDMYRESSGVGIGIWKTTDGGITWDLLPSTEGFKYITDLKVRDESENTVIYAGVVSGTYHGIPHQSIPEDGLYRSTDKGVTWQQVLPDIAGENKPYAPADIEITASGRVFVGTSKNFEGDGGSVILFSDLGTPGSWTVYDDYVEIIEDDPVYYLPDRVILTSAPSNPQVIYALMGAGYLNNQGFNYSKGRYILRSANGGNNWVQKNIPDNDPEWATMAWHSMTAAVDPNNSNIVFIGGRDVYRSTNGGNSWSHLSDWTLMYSGGGDEYVHCDQHTQTYRAGSSTEIFFTCDGGVFYTGNAQQTEPVFVERNRNYNTLQFYTCDIYPEAGQNYFVGGLQDNGTLLYQGDPPEVGDMIDEGDGACCFFDENQPSVMITSYYYNRYKIFLNWDLYENVDEYGSGIFINPADYDSDLNILFANAVTFTNLYSNEILRISGIPYNISGTFIELNTGLNTYFSCVKVSPHSPPGTSTLFIGSQNGKLFKVTNAQSFPQTVEIGSDFFPTAYISCIAVGGSEDTLMVTFSNYGVSKIWQTCNGGLNWYNKTGNLPDMPVRWALYHPDNAREAMIATELGVWHTAHLQQGEVTWEPEISGMANVRVDMLQMRNSDLTVLAATHGRGLYWTTWQPTIAPEAEFTADTNSITQGQSVQFSDLSTGNPDTWLWTFGGGDPPTCSTQPPPPVVYNTPGYKTISLTVSNSAGSDTQVKMDFIYVEALTALNAGDEQDISLSYDSFGQRIIVRAGSENISDARLGIFDCNGRRICSEKINVISGQTFHKPFRGTGPGIYLILLYHQGIKYTLKVIAGV